MASRSTSRQALAVGCQPQWPQAVQDHGQTAAQRQHCGKVDHAVFNQDSLKSEALGNPPNQHNAPGMEQIKQHRAVRQLSIPSTVVGAQHGKEEHHAQGQGEIHTVMALDPQLVQPQSLHAHQSQGKQEPPRSPLTLLRNHGRTQQDKQRREEQSIPRVGANRKDSIIHLMEHRQLGHQPIIAVSAQSHQIEHRGGGQCRRLSQPGQAPRNHSTQEHRRKVPEMIQRPIHQEFSQPCSQSQSTAVPIQRKIQNNRTAIDQ